MPSVGRHGVEKATLSLRKDEVEGEGGFSATRETGDDDHFVARNVEGDILEVVVTCSVNGDRVLCFGGFLCGGFSFGLFCFWFFRKKGGEVLTSKGFGFGNLFGGASSDDLSAVDSCCGAEIDEVIGALDDVEVVFNDEEGVSAVDEALEDDEQAFDVSEVEPRGRFVEDEESTLVVLLSAEELAEFEALGFAAGEGVEGLAESQVAESDVDEGLEEFGGFG